MKIPFSPPYINQDVIQEVNSALESGWITTGPKVKLLEELVCEYTLAPNTLCVNSATSGLMLALKWYGIGSGDEVIIPAYTYAATALAVIHVGATPVMVDVEADFNISIHNMEKAITSKTKAVIPVDIAGWPCDYEAIDALVKNKKDLFKPSSENQEKLGRILVISDSAHSIGATYNNQYLGAITDITVFSFHAVKNVTTAEGGAVCINLPKPFNNQEEYNYLRCFSLNGQTKDAFTKSKAGGWRYDIIYPGLKINMPDILAAIGVAQLPEYFEKTLDKRVEIYEYYHKFFQDISEATRDAIIEEISKNGVAVNVHFQPLPLLTLFKNMGYDIIAFPMAFNNYKREISLPIYPQLTQKELEYIVNTVTKAVESKI